MPRQDDLADKADRFRGDLRQCSRALPEAARPLLRRAEDQGIGAMFDGFLNLPDMDMETYDAVGEFLDLVDVIREALGDYAAARLVSETARGRASKGEAAPPETSVSPAPRRGGRAPTTRDYVQLSSMIRDMPAEGTGGRSRCRARWPGRAGILAWRSS